MNSINWPAPSVWVFIAQLVDHCSVNAEAKGLNPIEAPKSFFFSDKFCNCSNWDTTVIITSSFHLYFCSSRFTIVYASFLSWVDEVNKLACLPLYGSS